MLKPVYDFLGYSLTEAKYINFGEKENSYISINFLNDNFNTDNNQYNIAIRIATDFDDDESYFIFQAGFMINDLEWFNKLEEANKKNIFFSIVFPFVRDKILSITSDTNPGLFIPVLDLRTIDFEKELRLIKQ